MDLGSTKTNESLNNTVANKTPKSTFYSGSESNDIRVAAAVAQKQLGHQYVLQVNWEIRFILGVLLPFHRNLLKKIFQLHVLHKVVIIDIAL